MAEQGQTMAQHSRILSSLSTQLSQLVDLFSATPAEPPTPVYSPPPRRTSQVFSPTHGKTALPPGQSITVMSTKLAESAPILSTFNLYDVILYTRAYVDWTTRAGPNTVPPPFCTGNHGDVLETVCTELQMQYQDLVLLSTPEIIRLYNTYFLNSGLLYPFQEALRAVKDRLSLETILKCLLIEALSNIPSLFLAGSGFLNTFHAWSTSEFKICSRYYLLLYLSLILKS